MNRIFPPQVVLFAALSLGTLVAPAITQAADLDKSPIMEEVIPVYQASEATPVEFGTGWYLRGDIAVTSNKLNLTLNAGSWSDYQRDLGYASSVGIAGGYQLGKNARFEIGVERFFGLQAGERALANCADFGVTGTCYRAGLVELAATTFMVSAYYDIAEIWGVTPYIGAGVGTALLDWTNMNLVASCDGAVAGDCGGPGVGSTTLSTNNYNANTEWRFAYSVSAGIGYKLSKNLTLDASYRLTGISGGAFFDPARATTAGSNATFSTNALNIHQVKVGLRYAIW